VSLVSGSRLYSDWLELSSSKLPAMLLSLLGSFVLASQGVQTIELYRGANLPGQSPRYWAVEDTTLDSTQADIDQGWAPELYGAQGKNIVIQFKDLNRALGPHKKIVSASLVFTIGAGERVAFAGANELLQPWHEGPGRTLTSLNPDEPTQAAARWSATWRHRRAPDMGWEHAGATGQNDSRHIAEAKFRQPNPDQVAIDGLGQAVQRQYDRPQDNHGFMLRFEAPIEFASSKAPKDRPKLVLQYEDAPKAAGADLSVTFIERKPEYDRYQNDGGFTSGQQDGQNVPVLDHPLNALNKKWPADGEQLSYVAHIKNVGDAPSQGFSARWLVGEKSGATVDMPQTLVPGAEATVSIQLPYRTIHSDHRVQPIALQIEPKGADTVAGNNFLEIQENALNLGVWVEKGFADKLQSRETATGSHGVEDWIQQQVSCLNDVYFPFSRFSFATDGVLERVRVQRITVVPDGTLKGSDNLPEGKATLAYDAEIGFPASAEVPSTPGASLPLLRRICRGLGVVDMTVGEFTAGDPRLGLGGREPGVNRGTEDLFPGLMGGGDTRDESRLPRTFQVPYQPYADVIGDQSGLQPTDLLSCTDAAALTSDLGKRRGLTGQYLYDTPSIVALSILDYNGKKLPNVNLTFYQLVNGTYSALCPGYNVGSGSRGVVSMPKRDPGTGVTSSASTDAHVLRPNAFGRIDFNNGNGAFFVKAQLNGATEWSALKLWHFVDTYHRGQKSIALMNLAFNLPSDPLDTGSNVAKGHAVSDSASDAAATLAALTDGALDQAVSLPAKAGSSIELDLGRDRTIGEIRLFAKGEDFWNSFDISTYTTGQKPTEARPWSKEENWGWAYRNRADQDAKDPTLRSVAYRGPSKRFRYIRITNRSAVDSAKLVEIEAVPIKQQGEGG
jgi:hypothetical protein